MMRLRTIGGGRVFVAGLVLAVITVFTGQEYSAARPYKSISQTGGRYATPAINPDAYLPKVDPNAPVIEIVGTGATSVRGFRQPVMPSTSERLGRE